MSGEKILGIDAEKGRWLLVVCGLVVNLCLGTIYSWTVFQKPLQGYFTALGTAPSDTQMLLPFSIFLACFAIAMPLTGKYIEKFGPKKITIVGGVLTGLGWLSASFSTRIEMMYFTYGVIGGLGVGIAYGCPIAVSTRWFPDNKGLAVGLTVLGFGFSAFVTANLANWLIGAYGIMASLRIFGLLFIALIILLALPMKFPPSGWKPRNWQPPAKEEEKKKTDYTREEMLRTPTFYGLWFSFFIGCLAGLMAIGISKQVSAEVNVPAGISAMLVGFFAIFNGLGRPAFGKLTDMLKPRKTAILSFALIALSALLLILKPTMEIYLLSFAILWGCLGGWLAIAPAATAAFFGTKDYPRCYGVVFVAYGAGAIAGPLLAGYIKDTTGSYLNVFPYVCVLALIGLVVAFFLLRQK
ncbi:MAG: OFA family MFS transporter [Thermoplasmata archaeon]|nr:OFA family MFS transporter [Thermoplasmata archaeon]